MFIIFQAQLKIKAMDLNLFNMLKSVSETEKRLSWQTESYNISSMELKYPNNVISVAPPTGNAPPPLPGETRVTKLHYAVYTARLRAINGARTGSATGCSIVVYEGVYIDTFRDFSMVGQCTSKLSLEIVGIKNVRLVYVMLDALIAFGTVNLTLKNILIFDRRIKRQFAMIHIADSAHAEFIRVRIHANQAIAVSVYNKSKLSLVNSAITECQRAVRSADSVVHLRDCTINQSVSEANVLINLINSSFEAENCKFEDKNMNCVNCCIFFHKTKGTVRNCEFIGAFTEDQEEKPQKIALSVENGSSVFLQTSSIKDFSVAMQIKDYRRQLRLFQLLRDFHFLV